MEFLQKEYKSCMNWRLDVMQTNLLLLGFYRTFLSPIRLANDPYTLYKPLNTLSQVDLRDFEKHVNQVKKQYWALFFFISKADFKKTAIKPKFFDYRGSLKIFRSANNLCTIQSPNFAFIENLYSCLTQAQNWVKYWGCCAYRHVVRKQFGFQDRKNFFIT